MVQRMRETSEQLRAAAQRKPAVAGQKDAPEKPKPTANPGVAAPAASTSDAAVGAARQKAIAEAQLRQRVRRVMTLEMTLRPKFEALGLSAEQWHRYQMLSLELMDREAELRRAAKRGMTDEELDAFVRAGTKETLGEMRSLVGDAAYEELQQFQAERSHPVRQIVQALAQELMFSSAPLEPAQRQKLVDLLNSPDTVLALKDARGVLPRESLIAAEKLLTLAQAQALRRLQTHARVTNDASVIARQFEAAKTPPAASAMPKPPGG